MERTIQLDLEQISCSIHVEEEKEENVFSVTVGYQHYFFLHGSAQPNNPALSSLAVFMGSHS
jgi:hypothetical protein